MQLPGNPGKEQNLPRSFRMIALAGMACAAIAIAPASASAGTTVSPPNLDFGSVPVGTQSPSLPVTLTETCTSLTCVVSLIPDQFSPVIGATSGFTQTNACPASLLGALGIPQSCTIDVSFVPVVGGPISGVLNTGPGGPTVSLAGNGTPPQSANGVKRRKCKKHKKHARSAQIAKKRQCKKRR
jgi:hypothetical protein